MPNPMRLLGCAVSAATLLLAPPAHADLITVSFTGEVTEVAGLPVSVGEAVRGHYTYFWHDAVPEVGIYPADGVAYFGPGSDRWIRFGDDLTIRNDNPADSYRIGRLARASPTITSPFYYIEDSYGELLLYDPTGQAFQNEALTPEAPDLALFSVRSLFFSFQAWERGRLSVSIRVDSMVIPEPPSGGQVLLGSAATAFLAALRRRGRYFARAPSTRAALRTSADRTQKIAP